jgi:hypothetical protein
MENIRAKRGPDVKRTTLTSCKNRRGELKVKVNLSNYSDKFTQGAAVHELRKYTCAISGESATHVWNWESVIVSASTLNFWRGPSKMCAWICAIVWRCDCDGRKITHFESIVN